MRSAFTHTLLFAFASCGLIATAYIYKQSPDLTLTLEMAASGQSKAQLFFDTGSGFTEADSATVAVHSQSLLSFEHLSFKLPAKTLLHLRFDPLTQGGQFVIRHIAIQSAGIAVKKFTASQLLPLNQIASRSAKADEVEFATTTGANDPSVSIVFAEPIEVARLHRKQQRRLALMVNGLLVPAFFALQLLARPFLRGWGLVNGPIQRVARRLSSGAFLPLDGLAVWIYLALTVCFLLASALDLNGSSEGVYSESYGRGARVKPLFGEPLALRSDEWAYETPAILNQYLRSRRFASDDSVLGNHSAALAGNIPVNAVTTLFRPQLWPFFVLPVDYAFATYWQAKALLLMGGVFTFLLWITRSSGWALGGALWYFFSAFMQWSYSWPSALPEMVGVVCLGTVSFCYLTVGKQKWKLALAAVCTIGCAINFALCAYLPHLIPLIWLSVAIIVAWVVASRGEILSGDGRRLRLAVLLVVSLVVAGFGLHIYGALKIAIEAIAVTPTTGARLVTGGTLPLWKFASHFMQWMETKNRFPEQIGNMCEGSGFLWLSPVTLLCIPGLSVSRFQKAALTALWLCGLLLFCWCAFPMPAFVGQLLALNRCIGSRVLPALGLINVAIVAITAARFRMKPRPDDGSVVRLTAVYFLAAFFTFYVTFAGTNAKVNGFFSNRQMMLSAIFLAVLSVLLVMGRSRALAWCLVVPQMIAFGSVNPVERGLPVYTNSELNHFVQGHRELLTGQWLVYSPTPVSSGFFAAAGCSIYTGLRYVPRVDDFAPLAARGADLKVFDQLGYLDAEPIADAQKMRFDEAAAGIVVWKVAPSDPILPQVGIRYVAFDTQPAPALTQGLTALNPAAVDGFWLYRINSSK